LNSHVDDAAADSDVNAADADSDAEAADIDSDAGADADADYAGVDVEFDVEFDADADADADTDAETDSYEAVDADTEDGAEGIDEADNVAVTVAAPEGSTHIEVGVDRKTVGSLNVVGVDKNLMLVREHASSKEVAVVVA